MTTNNTRTQVRPPYPHPSTLDQAKENFRYYRHVAGISQAALARALHLQSPSINRWESHSSPTPVPIHRLDEVADILGAPPDDLTHKHEDYKMHKQYGQGLGAASLGARRGAVFVKDPQEIADYKNNIRFFRMQACLSQGELADKLGMVQSSVSVWENAENDIFPLPDVRAKVCAILGAPPNLLFPKYTPQPRPQPTHKPQPLELLFSNKSRVLDSSSNVRNLAMLSASEDLLSMSTNTCAAAGIEFPMEMQFDAPISELIGVHLGENIAVAKISGDSMYNPVTGAGIPDGAIVLIDTNKRDIEHALNRVVCYRINGSYMVKRLKLNNGALHAASDNPRYFPIFYSEDDQVELIGEVVSVMFALS